MSKVMITGGAGFIGSHIAELFLKDGHSVKVIDNMSSGHRDNLPAGMELHELDIRSAETRQLLAAEEPEVLVHAAAQISVRHSMEDPMFDTEVNVAGIVNLLQAFQGRRLPFFIFLSSGGAIYGEQQAYPASETHPAEPVSIYGLAKRVGEMYLDLWRRLFGLQFVALRLANVYGPRQNAQGEAGVVALFNDRLLRGLTPIINGSGRQTRDFVYVADVARAVRLAAQRAIPGVYNIGTGKETSIRELYQLIAHHLGPAVQAEHGPAKAGEQLRSSLDASLARRVLDWEPAMPIDEGLALTCQWFKEHYRRPSSQTNTAQTVGGPALARS